MLEDEEDPGLTKPTSRWLTLVIWTINLAVVALIVYVIAKSLLFTGAAPPG